MNRAQQYWAQVLDDCESKSDGPEAAIVEGLRMLKHAAACGRQVRARYRSGWFTVACVVEDDPYLFDGAASYFGKGRSILEAIERLGLHDAH